MPAFGSLFVVLALLHALLAVVVTRRLRAAGASMPRLAGAAVFAVGLAGLVLGGVVAFLLAELVVGVGLLVVDAGEGRPTA